VLLATPTLPSVAGGPGDPGSWDERFGAAVPDGEGEARARAHRAGALPARLGALYAEVRAMRESGAIDRERLADVEREARGFADDWLLRTEIEELTAVAAAEARAGTADPGGRMEYPHAVDP
jgi:phenylalanine-4-hydroxylase